MQVYESTLDQIKDGKQPSNNKNNSNNDLASSKLQPQLNNKLNNFNNNNDFEESGDEESLKREKNKIVESDWNWKQSNIKRSSDFSKCDKRALKIARDMQARRVDLGGDFKPVLAR